MVDRRERRGHLGNEWAAVFAAVKTVRRPASASGAPTAEPEAARARLQATARSVFRCARAVGVTKTHGTADPPEAGVSRGARHEAGRRRARGALARSAQREDARAGRRGSGPVDVALPEHAACVGDWIADRHRRRPRADTARVGEACFAASARIAALARFAAFVARVAARLGRWMNCATARIRRLGVGGAGCDAAGRVVGEVDRDGRVARGTAEAATRGQPRECHQELCGLQGISDR
jgi:hypothetical protein